MLSYIQDEISLQASTYLLTFGFLYIDVFESVHLRISIHACKCVCVCFSTELMHVNLNSSSD